MNPPLRGQEHVEAIIAGLKDGTIDCIASDHAPHAKEKKMQELDQAPFGIAGLETSLGLVVTRLIEPGHLDWPAALAKMTINPARILNLKKGTLADRRRRRHHGHRSRRSAGRSIPAKMRSKSSNTPFAGWELQGRAEVVVVGGKVRLNRKRDGE